MPTEPVKLLIVDDLQENLLALEALIRKEDRAIYQASSGEQALALMLQHEFALAILDVQMPGMNGFELAELMRGTEKTRQIPIIFVSAAGREQNYAFKGYETGAVDFLHKPLDPDAVKGKVSVFVDLYRQRTQLDRQLDELRQGRQEQEKLVEQLKDAKDELQRAVQMRDDFVNMVSHELRTPLNTLFLQTQMRRMHLDSGNAAAFGLQQLQTMVERDERQTQAMIKLIDDMLDVSRLRRGQLAIWPKPADLTQLVRRAVEAVSDQAADSKVEIKVQAPPALSGVWDEFRIEQVMANLLSNALRYGSGKPIEVTVAQSRGGATVTVKDQGIGIDPKDHQRIFNQFERAVDKQLMPGLGLGLYIARQILAAHGGTISVESQPGQGATFKVQLPLDSSGVHSGEVPVKP